MSRRKRFDEPDDQRIKRRFAIDEELRYKLLSGDRITEAGTGRVQNISSDGICFTTDAVLDYGRNRTFGPTLHRWKMPERQGVAGSCRRWKPSHKSFFPA